MQQTVLTIHVLKGQFLNDACCVSFADVNKILRYFKLNCFLTLYIASGRDDKSARIVI